VKHVTKSCEVSHKRKLLFGVLIGTPSPKVGLRVSKTDKQDGGKWVAQTLGKNSSPIGKTAGGGFHRSRCGR
jgi:hypothetical protein